MTPAEHRDEAVQLLADVNGTEAPSEARVLTQAAIAHALLGLLEVQIQRQEDRRPEWVVRANEYAGAASREIGMEIDKHTERNSAHGR